MSTIDDRILDDLESHGPRTVEQVAESLGIHIQTARKHIALLACEGSVRRVKGPRSQRMGRSPFAYELAA